MRHRAHLGPCIFQPPRYCLGLEMTMLVLLILQRQILRTTYIPAFGFMTIRITAYRQRQFGQRANIVQGDDEHQCGGG